MSAEPPAAAAAAEPASALSGSPELADWQMVQPLSAEEHAEHARIQQAHAEQQAPQQPAPPAASDDMQIDDGAGDDAAADGTVDSASVEEKRLLDQASSTSLAGSSVSASPDPTASSVRGEPSTSPMPHQQQQQPGDVDVEMRDVKTEGGVKSESDAAATPNTAAAGGVDTISVAGSLVPSASSAADEAARQAAIREEEDARAAREAAAIERKRMEDRKPTVMRTDCSRCGATISFPAPARLVHCAVCTHVNAITQANSVDTAKVPLTDKTLPQQAAQWNTLQVVVFLRSLSLQHLAPIFELHQVDGAQLLDLTYYDVRDVLRIQKPGDIENVLNCINILRGVPVATPNDLVLAQEANGGASKPIAAAVATPAGAPLQATAVAALPTAAMAATPYVAAIAAPANSVASSASTSAAAASSVVPMGQPHVAPVSLLPPSGAATFSHGGSYLPATLSSHQLSSIAGVSPAPSVSSSVVAFADPMTGAPAGGRPTSAHAMQTMVPQSPQGSLASMAHFANPTTTNGPTEGTTDHARAILLRQQQQPGAGADAGNRPMEQ